MLYQGVDRTIIIYSLFIMKELDFVLDFIEKTDKTINPRK